jgi:hypothetical protein
MNAPHFVLPPQLKHKLLQSKLLKVRTYRNGLTRSSVCNEDVQEFQFKISDGLKCLVSRVQTGIGVLQTDGL